MQNKLLTYIAENQLILNSEKTLLAVSGGKDSVCMAHLFHKLGLPFSIAHCNFKLRQKDSDLDQSFVQHLAQELDVDFYCKAFDVTYYAKQHGLSIQMAARDLRYDWFNELLHQHSLSKIATAHHQDDIVETLLIKKSRKSSLGALQGIPIKNGHIIRPMLCFSSQEIKNYLQSNRHSFRHDSSNDSLLYQRNKLRNKVIPHLSKEKLLLEIENNQKKYKQLLEKVSIYNQECYTIDDNEWVFPKSPLQTEGQWQEILYECLKFYGPFNWKDVFALMDASVGKKVFNNTYRLTKERDGLHLLKRTTIHYEETLIFEHTSNVDAPFSLRFSTCSSRTFRLIKDNRVNALDFDKLVFPLHLRKWQEGDAFVPLGMTGRKKVSDFLIDEKLTTKQKENTLVMCSLDDIVCVVGYRINDHYKLVPKSEKVYIVEPLNRR